MSRRLKTKQLRSLTHIVITLVILDVVAQVLMGLGVLPSANDGVVDILDSALWFVLGFTTPAVVIIYKDGKRYEQASIQR